MEVAVGTLAIGSHGVSPLVHDLTPLVPPVLVVVLVVEGEGVEVGYWGGVREPLRRRTKNLADVPRVSPGYSSGTHPP